MRKIIVSLVSIFGAVTHAHANVIAEQVVEKEIVTRGADGVDRLSRIPADTVAPGEEVIYTLKFRNESDTAAEAVVLVMPVPPEVSFVEGSVTGDNATVTFSADGGQTYLARGRLTIEEQGTVRPAKNDDITHIKWTLPDPLAAGRQGEIAYHAILK